MNFLKAVAGAAIIVFGLVVWTILWFVIGEVVEEKTRPDPTWQPGGEGLGVPVAVIGWTSPLWLGFLLYMGYVLWDELFEGDDD